MRLSTIIFFCLVIATIHAASITRRTTKKISTRKSVYDYLRSIRGNKTCSSGSCPFWEKHARSFLSLRCYSQQYQECVCLHRMCFSSCMFTKDVCNREMASCLQQICPRCAPTGQSYTCPIYNSLAGQVVQSLSNFVCYPCCASAATAANGVPGSNTATPPLPLLTTTPPANNAPATARPANGGNRPAGNGNTAGSANGATRPSNTANRPANAGNTVNRPANTGNTANRPANVGNTANRPANTGNTANRPVNAGNTANRPANAGNTVNRPVNAGNTANRPANAGNTANRPANAVNRPANGNQGTSNGNGGATLNQRVQKTKKTTRRAVSTKKPATVRTTTKAQKKPQANSSPKN